MNSFHGWKSINKKKISNSEIWMWMMNKKKITNLPAKQTTYGLPKLTPHTYIRKKLNIYEMGKQKLYITYCKKPIL